MMFETREEEVARKSAEAEAKGIVKGRAEGVAKKTEEVALGMLGKGYPLEDIAEIAKIKIRVFKARFFDLAYKAGYWQGQS